MLKQALDSYKRIRLGHHGAQAFLDRLVRLGGFSPSAGAAAAGASASFLPDFLVPFLGGVPLAFFEGLALDLATADLPFLGFLGGLALDPASSFTSFANGLYRGNQERILETGVYVYITIRKPYNWTEVN